MTDTNTLASFRDAFESAKSDLRRVNKRIEELAGEEQRIRFAPPHRDEIIACFQRGLREAELTFRKQLGRHLNDRNANGSAENVVHGSAQLALSPVGRETERAFGLEPDDDPIRSRTFLPQSNIHDPAASLSAAAIIYFLKDRIAEAIPALVDQLCPASVGAMPHDERMAEISRIAEETNTLSAERARLQAAIHEFRQIVSPRS